MWKWLKNNSETRNDLNIIIKLHKNVFLLGLKLKTIIQISILYLLCFKNKS